MPSSSSSLTTSEVIDESPMEVFLALSFCLCGTSLAVLLAVGGKGLLTIWVRKAGKQRGWTAPS